ncbi:hypothetical protein A0H81_03778 [Grifola frondosa]|uniref:N-acetyltransferase domain-containing protein n=1 Tax=Grifola frondosa TaxID=5627 RepID=A0A1C7MJP8_GRIFR|nr:hypothetical protein A0H81_03778 [Grifola frondosa]
MSISPIILKMFRMPVARFFANGDRRLVYLSHTAVLYVDTTPSLLMEVKQIATSKGSPDIIDKIVDYIVRFLRLFAADEQKKRQQEFSMKVSALVRSALGDRVAEMVEIRSLATSPAKQGCGYGSALVNTVTARADAEGRATWLITSDAYKFYETVGFSVVAMVREANGERQQSKKS